MNTYIYICRYLLISANICKTSVNIYKYLWTPIYICRYLLISVNICRTSVNIYKYLWTPLYICKYLQISANICKYLQISANKGASATSRPQAVMSFRRRSVLVMVSSPSCSVFSTACGRESHLFTDICIYRYWPAAEPLARRSRRQTSTDIYRYL